MVFFGERFRRDDEEDIWEELRQMLLNAPSEEEQWLNKKREQEYVDKILTQIFLTIIKKSLHFSFGVMYIIGLD